MHIDEIGLYGLNFIKSKARKLIGQYGFTWSDYEGLQQEILLDLIPRLRKHDEARSPRNAFITMVIRNKVRNICKQRLSPSREPLRGEVSLNRPLVQDGRHVELGDKLRDPRATEESMNKMIDLGQALDALPADLRQLWDWRVQGMSFTEISGRTGIPRPSLYDRWEKIVEHFKVRGMEDYFREK